MEREAMSAVLSDKFRTQMFLICALVGMLIQFVQVLSFLAASNNGVYTSGTTLQIGLIGLIFRDGVGFWLALIFASEAGVINALRARFAVLRVLIRKYIYGVDEQVFAAHSGLVVNAGGGGGDGSGGGGESGARADAGGMHGGIGGGGAGSNALVYTPGLGIDDGNAPERAQLRRAWFSIIRGAYEAGLVGQRTYFFRTYADVFVAREFVSWLVDTSRALNRDEAVDLGQNLGRYGVIHHVAYEHNFKDAFLFFRFSSDILTAAIEDLNMGAGSYGAIEAPPA
jgi:hypothetical protein